MSVFLHRIARINRYGFCWFIFGNWQYTEEHLQSVLRWVDRMDRSLHFGWAGRWRHWKMILFTDIIWKLLLWYLHDLHKRARRKERGKLKTKCVIMKMELEREIQNLKVSQVLLLYHLPPRLLCCLILWQLPGHRGAPAIPFEVSRMDRSLAFCVAGTYAAHRGSEH